MTPEIIQLAAEKGAPAKPAAKAPTASFAQADQQMQQNQHSQQAGPAPTPAQTQAPRPPFKSSPEGNADTPQGDENAQQPSSRPPFKASPEAGTDQTNPPQSIAAEIADDIIAELPQTLSATGATTMFNDARVRDLYKKAGEQLTEDIANKLKAHPNADSVTKEAITRWAVNRRNQAMEAGRKQSTIVAQQLAKKIKEEGKTFDELFLKNSNGKHPKDMAPEEISDTLDKMLGSAGKPQRKVNNLARGMKYGGGALTALAAGFALVEILEAENKAMEAGRQGAGLAGGVLGTYAGSALGAAAVGALGLTF